MRPSEVEREDRNDTRTTSEEEDRSLALLPPRIAEFDAVVEDFGRSYAHAERLAVPAAAESRRRIMTRLDPLEKWSLLPDQGHAAFNGAHVCSKSREYVVLCCRVFSY